MTTVGASIMWSFGNSIIPFKEEVKTQEHISEIEESILGSSKKGQGYYVKVVLMSWPTLINQV